MPRDAKAAKATRIVYVVGGYLTPDLTAYGLADETPKSLVVLDHGRRKTIRKSDIRGFAYSEDEARKIADAERAKRIASLENEIADLRKPLKVWAVDPEPWASAVGPIEF
jgi:hypothetical protein